MGLAHQTVQIDPFAIGSVCGVLITDHNARETLEIIDHASVISGGSVLFKAWAEDVIRDPEVRRVYLGDMYGCVPAGLADYSLANGAPTVLHPPS